jgi:hypothetical protein
MTGTAKERTEGKRIRKDRAIKKLRGQFEGVRQQTNRETLDAKRRAMLQAMKGKQ